VKPLLVFLTAAFAVYFPNAIRAADCQTSAHRWNVVLIVADDLGWGEVGCFGQERIPTPHLDRLAAEGMRLTRHYSGAPTCAPSRCTLLTGLHTGHADIRGNRQARDRYPQFTEGQHPIEANTWTLAEAFRAAGYHTAAFGKWGLGPVGSTGDPNDQGFDLFFGYNCQSVAHSYYPPHLWRNRERVTLNVAPVPAHPKLGEQPIRMEDWIGEQYAPQRMIDEAVSFLNQPHRQPFFLYLPFIEPHVAMHPRPESLDRFPKEWDDEPYRGENGYLPHPRPRAAYAAMVADLDAHVGRILATLETRGLVHNTLVIFTSDNGTTHAGRDDSPFSVGGVDARFFNSTRGLRGYKGSLHEGGIRVPTIVRLPGQIPAGTTCANPSYFPDWFPTLAEATGIHGPPQADGESLWRSLTGQPSPARSRPMTWVFAEYQGQVAVRIGSCKILRKQLLTAQPGPWEVYDLQHDEQEQHDLAATRPDLIRMAEQVLACEMTENPTFPMPLPGISKSDSSSTSP
jgi:arylsulfatase A-like enzyme